MNFFRKPQNEVFVKKENKSVAKIETLMNFKIPVKELPADLVISTVLTPDEMPKISSKIIELKIPKKDLEAGSAFHEKKEKNKKVNNRRSRAEMMKLKYKKPKTRGQKK